MKQLIRVETPVYNNADGDVTIKLTNAGGGQAEINFDFNQLLPFVNLVSPEVVDFFILSACTYGIDRFIERRVNSVDGWSRELSVNLPVTNLNKWLPLKEEIGSLLSFLTGD